MLFSLLFALCTVRNFFCNREKYLNGVSKCFDKMFKKANMVLSSLSSGSECRLVKILLLSYFWPALLRTLIIVLLSFSPESPHFKSHCCRIICYCCQMDKRLMSTSRVVSRVYICNTVVSNCKKNEIFALNTCCVTPTAWNNNKLLSLALCVNVFCQKITDEKLLCSVFHFSFICSFSIKFQNNHKESQLYFT